MVFKLTSHSIACLLFIAYERNDLIGWRYAPHMIGQCARVCVINYKCVRCPVVMHAIMWRMVGVQARLLRGCFPSPASPLPSSRSPRRSSNSSSRSSRSPGSRRKRRASSSSRQRYVVHGLDRTRWNSRGAKQTFVFRILCQLVTSVFTLLWNNRRL